MRDDSSNRIGVLTEGTALIVIDVQKGFDEAYWGERNNPGAEQNIARLLDAWRRHGWPVYFIQHQSKNPQSPLRPNYVGSELKDVVRPQPGESVLQKTENSAFIGTDLEERLRSGGQGAIVVTGLITDHCVSTTARMAANLGFDTIVVSDATATFDRYSPITSRHFTAEEIHEAELTSLNREFARIADTDTVVRALESAPNRGEAEPAAMGALYTSPSARR